MIYLNTLSAAKSLSVDGKSIRRLSMTRLEQGGIVTRLIWTKDNYIEIHYLDEAGNLQVKQYTPDEFVNDGGSLTSFNTQYQDIDDAKYYLTEPFATLLGGKALSNLSKLKYFYDNSHSILSSTGGCFTSAVNMIELTLPGLQSFAGELCRYCSELTSATLSSVGSIATASFAEDYKLSGVYIDTNTARSYSDGYGHVDSIGLSKKASASDTNWTFVYSLPIVTKIRCDIVTSISNSGVNAIITDLSVPNLTSGNGSFARATSLTSLYVNNSTLQSDYDDFGIQGVLLSENGKKLYSVIPAVKQYTNNDITGVYSAWKTGTYISSLNINNNYFKSIDDGNIVINSASTIVYFTGPWTQNTIDRLNSIQTLSVLTDNLLRSVKFEFKIHSANLSNILSIGEYAFYNSNPTRLNSLSIDNCRYLGMAAFQSTTRLKEISISSLSVIPKLAFYRGNDSSSSNKLLIKNADNVQEIGDQAFYQIRNIQFIDFPELTSIGSKAFYNAQNTQYAYIPKASVVKDKAFCYCRNLSSLNISDVTSLSSYEKAFEYCDSLSVIHCENLSVSEVMSKYADVGWNQGCSCYCSERMIVL